MEDEKRDTPEAIPGGKRRRSGATIDLKATEIVSEPVTPNNPADSSEQIHHEGEAAPPHAARPRIMPWRPLWLSRLGLYGLLSGRLRYRLAAAAAAGVVGGMIPFFAAVSLLPLTTPAPREDQTRPLAARIASAEAQVRDLASKPQPVADPRPFADLEARLAKAEQGLGGIAALDARVAKAESTAAAPLVAPPDQATIARIAAVEAGLRPLAELGSRAEAATAAARDAKARADAAFETAQQAAARPVAPPVDRGEIDALARRIATLEQVAKGTEAQLARVAATSNADRAGRLAFIATALRSAVERGEPFAAELSAAKPLTKDAALLTPLEPYAAAGVPRSATLAAELSALTRPMLDAAGTPAREGGIVERLQANAERLVRIRPLNEGSGDDPATVVTRADTKARQGDIAGTIAELSRLPQPVRAPALGWIKKAEAQVAALAAARQAAETALAGLANVTP